MAEFSRVAGEGVRAAMEVQEADLLRHLIDEMKLVLDADIEADPVTKRLFPDAYDDPGRAEEFAGLVGDELRAHKAEALRVVRDRLGPRGGLAASIPDEETDAWLTLLTDLRLAIGTRLDVTEDTMSEELDPGHPDAAAMSVLHWLGWVQESLIDQLRT